MRAFRSELLKFRRWSVLAGSGVMILATAFIAYLTFHQIASGATGPEITPLIQAFPMPQGLITVVGQARSLIIVIALIMVTSNIAAEWSQGTLRNLLVREPRRLRLLAGKMLALLLFVTISAALTLAISVALILAAAHAQGISTSAWTSSDGMRTFLAFFGKTGRAGNPQGAVVRRDCVARRARDPGHQLELRRLLGFDHQLSATIQELTGGTAEQGLALIEHH